MKTLFFILALVTWTLPLRAEPKTGPHQPPPQTTKKTEDKKDSSVTPPVLKQDSDQKIEKDGKEVRCPSPESAADYAIQVHSYLRSLNPNIRWNTEGKKHLLPFKDILFRFTSSDTHYLSPGQRPKLIVDGVGPEELGYQLCDLNKSRSPPTFLKKQGNTYEVAGVTVGEKWESFQKKLGGDIASALLMGNLRITPNFSELNGTQICTSDLKTGLIHGNYQDLSETASCWKDDSLQVGVTQFTKQEMGLALKDFHSQLVTLIDEPSIKAAFQLIKTCETANQK